MSKIRVLPEQLANRIAAGEVVERPASVVKELIENSLDAGATRIEIEVEDGGTRLIRIIDNGEGMDEDDVLLCLERHGTSKILADADLEAINSLGFRGEAIPSISSVSRMTITSREQSADFGTTAVLNYGKLYKIHETGSARGTIVEIRNLFGNTPARRKFLRTKRTELGHIDEVVKNYALAAPQVAFILRIDTRQTLHLDHSQGLAQRLATVLHYSGSFIEIGYSEPGSSLPRLSGLLVPPDSPLTGSARIKILVNGRSVKDRMLTHGVAEGLRGFLMKGRNPAGLLHLHLDPADVDVNVHPTKQEVRFRRSRDIHQLIVQAIQQGMQGYQQTLKSSFFKSPAAAVSHPESSSKGKPYTAPSVVPLQTVIKTEEQIKTVIPETFPTVTTSTAEPLPQIERSTTTSLQNQSPRPTPLPQEPQGHGLKIIGQYDKLYIFCQSSDGLVVIDQHAAHERLLFEKLKKQFLKGNITRQTLLFPETIELSVVDTAKVEQYGQEIDKMGFTIREFGGNSYVISAVPALGNHLAPAELFFDILEQFGSPTGNQRKGSLLEDVLASMACKAAIKSGDALSLKEIEALLDSMARADLFSHCPHGRPVLKQFTETEIKKWFHRS
ncbi:DNA mismatch repair protein MutL [Desulfocapsa sulfexigens DSM 10523]|uniref:DNA mismatch repair protein MutL n=1 Tax=Desulfocapsa sulfexigens (strain DSM 10523 / SB164P1) TaxID=1167006 RepID=M1NZE5_DESSD|nr:DNA mismatch repair endonuclease MutL [Desulfocapsa sulfexigens]AGF76628.1 DNA mismatch repair protein MutL [Desulfocapsa sulfexigens DSM 10523]